MTYVDHFQHADDIVAHLNTIMPTVTNPLLSAKYVGFVAVASVTVYEVAIKDIFITFAKDKHKVLGAFTESFFNRINGKISIDVIKNDYIKRFGKKYLDKFEKKLSAETITYLRANGRDIKSSYSNLITWRNDFAHAGKMNTTSTYAEVVQAYEDGKEVIRCLAETMVR
jgi:hypothetical protein